MEFQLDPVVEGDPEWLFRFTHRIRHPGPTPPPLSI